MGGCDKALLMLGGRTLLDRVVGRLAPQVGQLALNANGDASRFDGFSGPVLADVIPGYAGPLAGVLTAMDWARKQGAAQVLTVAADTPFLPLDLAQSLTKAGGLALAESPDENGVARLHPTAGLWPVSLSEPLAQALEAGERRIGKWALSQGAQRVCFDARPDPFLNLNTPEDMANAEAALRADS